MKVCLITENVTPLYDSVTAQEESINKMWSEYLEDVKEFDTGLTETWKEDANGVLTFVSLRHTSACVRRNNKL
jgi:chloramphenicol O-acetyltransferase